MASVQDPKSMAELHLSSSAQLRDPAAGSSSTSSPSETRLLQRIERLEAELAAVKKAGGHKTDADVEMDREAHVRRLPPGALPVRAWFRGAVPVNARCNMLWNDNNSKLTVSFSDAAAGVAAHALELDLREVVSVNYTDADDTRNHPVVALRTAQMQITLSLEACDAEWSGTRYRELVAWIQAQLGENDGVDVFCCRYAVTQNIWETVAKVANEDGHAPAAPKQLMANATDPESAQNLFRAMFGPTSHLQLEPDTKYLPIKAWYLRGRLSQAAEAYIVWPVSGRVCIVGAKNDLVGYVEELEIGTAAKCAWFVDPKENYANKVFVLQTAQLEPAGALSSRGGSQILIKFDGASAKWADSSYEAFVLWIKGKVDQYAVIRGKIGEAKWEAATKTFAITGTDPSVAVGGKAHAEPSNKERPETHLQNTVGDQAPAELEGEQPRALNDEARVSINFESMPIPKKPDNKKSIKPKNTTAAPLENDRIPTSRPPAKNPILPIKAWFLGRKLFEEPYHLTWTAAGKMTIRSGDDPNAETKHSEEIDMTWFAQRIWLVEPAQAYADKVFVLETYEMFNNKQALGTQFSEFFKPGGKHAEGHIMIKFDSTSPAWADPTYAQFVDWLKARVDNRESLRGIAGDAKWEAMKRMELVFKATEDRIRRENGGSVAPARVNAKSPTGTKMSRPHSSPASAITANRKSPTKRKSYPIDPPPLYRGAVVSRFSDTLDNSPRGNLSAQMKVVSYSNNARSGPPPNKRARVESSAPRSREKVSQSSNPSFRPLRLGEPDTGVIYVDDQYEDVGERIQSQPGELDFLPSRRIYVESDDECEDV